MAKLSELLRNSLDETLKEVEMENPSLFGDAAPAAPRTFLSFLFDAQQPLWLTLPLALFLLQYVKAFPFGYHVRVTASILYNACALLLAGRGLRAPSAATSTSHVVLVGDLDWNFHQNNSCYALEADVSRYSWFLQFFGKALLAGSYKLANGGFCAFFYREMRVWQRYTITTALQCVDEKWFYLEERFTPPATPRQPSPPPFAVALTRIVVKQRSGKTVPPAEVMAALGYEAAAIAELVARGKAAGAGGPSLSAVAAALQGAPAAAAAAPREEPKKAK